MFAKIMLALVVVMALAVPVTPMVGDAVAVSFCDLIDTNTGAGYSPMFAFLCFIEILWDNGQFDEWMER